MADNILNYVKNFIYGFRFRRLKVDSALHIPEMQDDAGNVRINKQLEVKVNGVWVSAGGGIIDPTPTPGSNNAVASGGAKTYIDSAAAVLAGQDTILQNNIIGEAAARQQGDQNVIDTLKAGVPNAGDNLSKLYFLILSQFAEINVPNAAARDAYNITAGNHIFVIDDGDGKWALYKALTSGVNASYIKLTDADLFNSVMSATAIKAAYESNADTNAFTNALKQKLENLQMPDVSGIAINDSAIKNEAIAREQGDWQLQLLLHIYDQQRVNSEQQIYQRINGVTSEVASESRFGVGDNLLTEEWREFDVNFKNFLIKNYNEFRFVAGPENPFEVPEDQQVSDISFGEGFVDMQVYKGNLKNFSNVFISQAGASLYSEGERRTDIDGNDQREYQAINADGKKVSIIGISLDQDGRPVFDPKLILSNIPVTTPDAGDLFIAYFDGDQIRKGLLKVPSGSGGARFGASGEDEADNGEPRHFIANSGNFTITNNIEGNFFTGIGLLNDHLSSLWGIDYRYNVTSRVNTGNGRITLINFNAEENQSFSLNVTEDRVFVIDKDGIEHDLYNPNSSSAQIPSLDQVIGAGPETAKTATWRNADGDQTVLSPGFFYVAKGAEEYQQKVYVKPDQIAFERDGFLLIIQTEQLFEPAQVTVQGRSGTLAFLDDIYTDPSLLNDIQELNATVAQHEQAIDYLNNHIGGTDYSNQILALQNDLKAEIASRDQGDGDNTNALKEEQHERVIADNQLSQRITSLAENFAQQTTQANLTSEIATRAAEDATLQQNLTTEANVRITADNALAARIDNIIDSVPAAGNTLLKLYNIAVSSITEITVANIAARNSYNAPLGGHVFVTNDGDNNWALYKASTAGVNATYVKLSDPDLLSQTMSASAIKAAYESNPDTNAFTNAHKQAIIDLQASSTTESNARQNADTTLQSNISAETTARQSADTNLQNAINTVQSTAGSNSTAITNETTARQNADTALQNNISSEATARQNADTALQTNISTANSRIDNLIDSVPSPGDTLKKIYNIAVSSLREDTVANIAARNSYNVTLGQHIFVTDDGDGNWALYKATSAGTNASYIKLSDPDMLNQVLTAAQLKATYESNPDTNAFTNAYKQKIDDNGQAIVSLQTSSSNNSSSLTTETSNRQSADTILQNNITAEVTARQNANTTLQNNIASEITARQNAVSVITTKIANLNIGSEFAQGNNSPTPTSGMLLQTRTRAGKRFLSALDPAGFAMDVQGHFADVRPMISEPSWNSSSFSSLGHPNITFTGSQVLYPFAATNARTALRRGGVQTASATAGLSANLRNGAARIVSRIAGHFFELRFAIPPTPPAGYIFYAGLCEQITAMNGTTNPSAILNLIGVGKDSADSNFFFMFNNGSGTATKVDTGLTPDFNEAYIFRSYCKPNDTIVYVSIELIGAKTIVELAADTTAAVKLPTASMPLGWQLALGNTTVAAIATVDYGGLYAEAY